MIKTIFYLSLIFIHISSIYNPGLLITIPFPQQPPSISIPLPISINDTLIQNLQLTQINVRQIIYNWKMLSKYVQVNVTVIGMTFSWSYKGHSGIGTFTQQKLKLNLNWVFTTKKQHLDIQIQSSKITPGHSKVTLGGSVPQTIAIEVTNIILNHASILFRSFIGKTISSALTNIFSSLGQDQQIYVDSQSGKHFYINTSLVANPLFSNQTLVLQFNGAPYILGQKSGVLAPSQILIKQNINKIQVQIHKNIIDKLIQLIKKARGILQVKINSVDISSTLDIDSIALSSLFPQMSSIYPARSVFFDVILSNINVSMQNTGFKFLVQGYAQVGTLNARTLQPYIKRLNSSFEVVVSPIFNSEKMSVRIKEVKILSVEADPQDIANNKIHVQMISKYFPVLMQWIQDGINIGLNKKVIKAVYQDINLLINGRVLNSYAYNIELQIKHII